MIEVKGEKLYVCQVDGEIKLMTRWEADECIRDIEENDNMSDFSNVGHLNTADLATEQGFFLIVCKLGDITITDVITAKDMGEATAKFVSKKRFQKSKIKPDIKSIKDLTNLVKLYYK